MFQQVTRLASRRAFSSTVRRQAHYEEGVYSNIPMKIHNRRIPYAVLHFGFFALGFSLPFVAVYVQFKKAGL
ncbi:AER062Cp [Eremothecium gossypii ATCC 10895]|uniref:Cytochrome c oxidase subunit 8, mitochondrial n=1 Tax=Eremothecium gossypii (strain ATCC 10895 / CBS 109.51 / FGSC 9923 / NRRL Y-1056) TaxID=284811 RepID=Q757F1_EREGS|nr:AER062Cp [Eremothecium gossypii ATCC 10895]AAS52746.1 AER062Cp [Eremothecium gossypii ATCC 10895]AEY97052.1 FAER062Cp [Eremothecium gossypii FDAG1]